MTKIKGSSRLLLETPLTRSKCISPYTHAQHLTQTSRTFYTFAVTKQPEIPLHAFPWRVGAPSYGESWIRPCLLLHSDFPPQPHPLSDWHSTELPSCYFWPEKLFFLSSTFNLNQFPICCNYLHFGLKGTYLI